MVTVMRLCVFVLGMAMITVNTTMMTVMLSDLSDVVDCERLSYCDGDIDGDDCVC